VGFGVLVAYYFIRLFGVVSKNQLAKCRLFAWHYSRINVKRKILKSWILHFRTIENKP